MGQIFPTRPFINGLLSTLVYVYMYMNKSKFSEHTIRNLLSRGTRPVQFWGRKVVGCDRCSWFYSGPRRRHSAYKLAYEKYIKTIHTKSEVREKRNKFKPTVFASPRLRPRTRFTTTSTHGRFRLKVWNRNDDGWFWATYSA